MKRFILLFSLLAGNSLLATAQETSGGFWSDPVNHPMAPLYLVSGLVIITILVVVIVLIYIIRILNIIIRDREMERAAQLGISYVPPQSWLSQFFQKMNASVPIEKEADIDMGHEFDGIRELDNHLPPWWKWLFYGTVVWSVIYMVLYHVTGSLPLSLQEYQDEVARAEALAFQRASSAEAIDVSTLTYDADPAILSSGRTVFVTNCVSCHRSDGGGNTIGPNLTDEYWLHGGDIRDIFNTINNGVVEKGMPAWGQAMSQENLRDVAFYVMSLQGTTPADAKGPQGERYEPVAIEGDTTTVE